MMSALHLFWIIPLAGTFGYFLGALMAAAGKDKK